jgi:hypothetical protein
MSKETTYMSTRLKGSIVVFIMEIELISLQL